MAHIPDAILSTPVLVTGGLVSASLLAAALRRLDYDRVPQAAVLSAAFFVSSLINVPVGPSSVHLLLNGLMGLLLGWTAVPALLVALILQAAFFGFGGILVLGVNTMNMAVPALVCALLVAPWMRRLPAGRRFWGGFAAGSLGVLMTGLMVALALGLSADAFTPAAKVLAVIYLPLALVEGLITATIVGFIQRVAPELLAPVESAHA
ncbi:cobalt transporter CbiM [Thiocystis violacea]|uniref:cobalt transporter CbiM n=1 Tax=Thiocystis violacea TaxID=13725 RepID=UPI0019056880|nr:cobalt transporter CbiM [Thiocystis violacea]MBK1723456.1 cobalamin biosynthesis protein CbiM [Thiocystis violacea]